MKGAMGDDVLDRIRAAARTPAGKNKAGHSELYEWYRERYDELAPSLLPPNTPNWGEVSAEFASLLARGEPVRDGGGNAPSSATCRKTFLKVGEDKLRLAGYPALKRKPRGKSAKPASVEFVQAARSSPPPRETPFSRAAMLAAEPALDTDNPYGFRPVGSVKTPSREDV